MSIASNERAVVDAVTPRLHIGGEWRDAAKGGTFAVEDPSTGEPLCEVADATVEDAEAAVDAAVAATSCPVASPSGDTPRPCRKRRVQTKATP